MRDVAHRGDVSIGTRPGKAGFANKPGLAAEAG